MSESEISDCNCDWIVAAFIQLQCKENIGGMRKEKNLQREIIKKQKQTRNVSALRQLGLAPPDLRNILNIAAGRPKGAICKDLKRVGAGLAQNKSKEEQRRSNQSKIRLRQEKVKGCMARAATCGNEPPASKK